MRRTLDGDETLVAWTADDPASVEAARALLLRETTAGYMAVRDEPGSNEPVDDLPADAELVVLTMPMGGG